MSKFQKRDTPYFPVGEGGGEETMNDLSNKVIISLQQQHFLLMILLFFSVVNDVNLSEFHLNNDVKKYLNGLINEKCLSILIFLSRIKKLYFQEKS